MSLLLSLAAPVAGGDYKPYVPPVGGVESIAPLFVIIAYSAIWLVLMGYLVSLWGRQRRVEEELGALQRRLS